MSRVSPRLLRLALEDSCLRGGSPPNFLFLNAHIPSESVTDVESVTDDGLGFRLLDIVECEQPYRPHFVELERLGYRVESHRKDSESSYDGAFLVIDRSRDYTRHLVCRAVMSVRVGGVIFVMGEKTYGISSHRSWLSERVGSLESTPKYHSNLLRFAVTESVKDEFEQLETDPNSGLFGLKEDRGSRLLADTFGYSVTGSVADFCSGTGYLSSRLCEVSSPSSLTLIDADRRALEYSREHCEFSCPSEFFWLDLTCEFPSSRYDWIIMNPPFHRGRAAEPFLGQSIIRAAHSCLAPNGRLRLVANRGLPYEGIMSELFGSVECLLTEDGFKILEGRV